MDRPFTARRGGGVEAHLTTEERASLASLLGQLDALLDDGQQPSDDPLAELVGLDDPPDRAPEPPEDPAVARLLPEANRDDPEAAGEFRRLTESGLRSRKRAGARRAAEALLREPARLDAEEAQSLLKALADLRLVLGERLDLRTDDDYTRLQEELQEGLDAGIEPHAGWFQLAATFETLHWLQDSLVQALSRRR
jgi:hypothetical protein